MFTTSMRFGAGQSNVILSRHMIASFKFGFIGGVGRGAFFVATACLVLWSLSSAKVSEKEKFMVRVVKVKSRGDGCNADVQSNKVRYEISSDVSGDCAVLRAGEEYKVFVSPFHPKDLSPDDRSGDLLLMVVEDNKAPEKYAVFHVDSQEVRGR